jgi:transposase
VDEISVIGIDLAKNVFQLAALSPSGAVVWDKRLKRQAFKRFMSEQAPRCTVGMEACGGAHYWGRWLGALGYAPKLMAPRAVRAYRQGVHKNDRRDARAVGEATRSSQVAAIPVKSEAAQTVQALMRLRERRIRQLGQTSNQLRGLLNEFGVVLPKGRARMLSRLAELAAAGELAALPAAVRELTDALVAEIAEQAARAKAASAALAQAVAEDATCALLMTIPNIGAINAAALSVALETPAAFANGRAFAASLKLVPRQHASAETTKLRGIGRSRRCELRRYLVLAAQSLLTRVDRMKQPPADPMLAWAHRLLRRKMRNVAAVAVAGKLARIAWAVRASNRPYHPRGSADAPSARQPDAGLAALKAADAPPPAVPMRAALTAAARAVPNKRKAGTEKPAAAEQRNLA